MTTNTEGTEVVVFDRFEETPEDQDKNKTPAELEEEKVFY